MDSGTYSGYGEVNGTHDKGRLKLDKNQFVATLSKIQETGPSIHSTNVGTMNGSAEARDESNRSEENKLVPKTI